MDSLFQCGVSLLLETIIHFLMKIFITALDLKNAPGDIYRGTLEKGKVDCTLIVEDEVITDIFTGKEDALKVGHTIKKFCIIITLFFRPS